MKTMKKASRFNKSKFHTHSQEEILWWKAITGLGNGLLPLGDKLLPEKKYIFTFRFIYYVSCIHIYQLQ